MRSAAGEGVASRLSATLRQHHRKLLYLLLIPTDLNSIALLLVRDALQKIGQGQQVNLLCRT